MNVQELIPFTPFLGVIFLFFALIQALRHKQQGAGTAFLALLAIGVPVAAYILVNDSNVQVALIQFMAINAAIVFIGSIIILLIERGNPTRDMNHSYGMLGIGLALLLALGIFLTPMLAKASNNLSGANNTTGAGGQTGQGNAQVIQALTQQTGLTVADLNTQLSSGSTTIAQLVSAHSGNLTAVTSAISTALDQLNASGAQSAAFLSRLGSSSDVATQLVQGQLQSRVQTLLVNLLLNGSTGFGGGSGAGGTGGTGGSGSGNGSGNGGTGGTGGNGTQSTQQASAGGNGGFGGNNSSGSGSGGNGGSGGSAGGFGGFGGQNGTPAAPPSGNGGNGGNGGFGGFGGNAQSTQQAAPNGGNGGFGGFGGSANATPAPQAAPSNNGASEQSLAPTNTPEQQSIAQVPTQAPAATQAAASSAETPVAQVLAQQTGLSVADLTTQLNSGSTIAQLVTAHNGDATAVSTAITNALDQFAANNTQGSQLLSRLGNSSSDIAGEVIQGTLPGRSQQIVMAVLLTGSLPSFGGNGGGNGGSGFGGNGGGSGAAQAAPTATATIVPTPTATIMRPTLIVFPTDTPTPVGTEEATAEATAGATGSAGSTSSTGTGACTLVTEYSLNMRDKPSKDNGVVLLSVPINTSLSPTSKTSDGWYAVSYGGHSGWVDGSFTAMKGSCSSLPTATSTPASGG